MCKRFLVMTIVLAIFVSLSLSVSALAKTADDVNLAEVKEVIIDEIGEIQEKINEKKGTKEIASVEEVDPTEKNEILFEVLSTEGASRQLQNIVITQESLSEIEQTETTVTEATETAATEVVETEPEEVEETEAPEEKKEEEIEERLRIVLVETQEDDTRIFSFKGQMFTVPDVIVNEEPRTTSSGYEEKIYNVPQYFQQSYPKTRYGNYGTVSSHGCGITSIAMVYSYLLDKEIMPDELAAEYGRFNTEHGSSHALFETTANDYGLAVEKVYKWQDVVEALENGCVVISNVRENLFTAGGHFIVYYGITEEGRILVRDPNIYNFGQWSAKALKDGFYNGFEDKYVKYSFPCWIYAPKDFERIAMS